MASLNGKVAIVTGSSRGIGRAIVERFARDGGAVVVNYASSTGEPRDIAGVVALLAGEEGRRWITNAKIRCDGGIR